MCRVWTSTYARWSHTWPRSGNRRASGRLRTRTTNAWSARRAATSSIEVRLDALRRWSGNNLPSLSELVAESVHFLLILLSNFAVL